MFTVFFYGSLPIRPLTSTLPCPPASRLYHVHSYLPLRSCSIPLIRVMLEAIAFASFYFCIDKRRFLNKEYFVHNTACVVYISICFQVILELRVIMRWSKVA